MNWKSVKFDWNNTRAFLVTAEEGTLSAAAKALGLTQPTLSRQVAALESEIGVTLFERVGQRLVLTQSGMELLTHAHSMGDAALQFSLAATGQSQQIEGNVVISAGELDAVFRLPKIIAKLRQIEPGIDIEVVVTNQPSDLKRREADIAIRNFRPSQNDLIAKKLGEESIWLYGTQEYLDQLSQFSASKPSGSKSSKAKSSRKKSSEITDYSNIQIIGFEQGNAVSEVLKQKGWQLSNKNIRLLTTFQMLQLELCKEGLGVIFFPEDIGDNYPGLVRAFENMGPTMQLSVWLVCHQELRTNLRVRRVFDFIASELGQTL
jgi:DNA-binding transcriptional LysR family regulator